MTLKLIILIASFSFQATMCNDGGLDHANMGCLEGKEFDCDLYEYAIRDIKEGDEILSNYAIMDDEPAWSDLGLL